jgi:hypothetical protein
MSVPYFSRYIQNLANSPKGRTDPIFFNLFGPVENRISQVSSGNLNTRGAHASTPESALIKKFRSAPRFSHDVRSLARLLPIKMCPVILAAQ